MMPAVRSLRVLRRYWALTLISLVSLTVAMALGVAGLSVANTFVVLAPAATEPDRLVMIHSRQPGKEIEQISYPDYDYYRKNNHVFSDVAAAPNSIAINDDFNFEGRDVKVGTRAVSENYFAVLGIRPFLGRFFSPGDDRSKTRLAVMTYSCWNRLGADPHIVGKVLANHTIVGVAPKEFTGSFFGFNGDLLTTLGELDDNSSWFTKRGVRRLILLARLKPGVTRRQAQAEMAALSRQLASAFPKDDKDRAAVVTRATLLPPDAIPTAEVMSAILIALLLLVLFIACANVANLLLAVAVGRRQEAAIKLALGAPRGRLIREFLAESAVLCAAGGVLGYLLAAAAIARYSDFSVAFPSIGTFSAGMNLRLDALVVAFTIVLILIATLATGLAPALYASSPGLAQVLGGEIVVGGTRKRVRRNALVVAQVAVCTLVLVGMGLCQRNIYNLRHADLGFSARNLIAVEVYMEAEGYSEARGKDFYWTLRRTVAALPGVEAVTLAWDLPPLGAIPVPVQFPNRAEPVWISHTVVDDDYFRTLEMPLLAGRGFNSSDREGGAAVAVINHKMAEIMWPSKDPLGRTITAGDPARKVTVVGVAVDGKYVDVDEPTRPFMYFPLRQNYGRAIHVIARTKGDPRLWVEPVARALRGLGLTIMIQPVTMDAWMNFALITQRIAAGCVAFLSALGLLLAIIGLFGAISYSVSERKKELGIRVALGARPWQLLQMVLHQTAAVAGTGVAIGVGLGVGATILFRSQFFGIRLVEWTVLIPTGAAMLVLSLVIAYLSARPWIGVDPMDAVRHP